MKGNDRADRLAFRKILIVEELETLREGTKPRISHRRWPAGERRRKRKRWVILPEQERRQQLHRETDGSSETEARLATVEKDRLWEFSSRRYHLKLN